MLKQSTPRGVTLIEVMIAVVILGVVVVFVSNFLGLTLSGEGGVFDRKESARAWAEDLGYTVEGARCADIDSDADGYVSCSVKVAGQGHPIPLECHVYSGSCRQARILAIP